MSLIVDSIFTEWRSALPEGSIHPNIKNSYHLFLLKDICLKRGISENIVNDVILTLEQDNKNKLDDKEREKAKKMGLVSKGFGNWAKKKDGPTTHRAKGGKLVAVGDDKETDIKKPDINPMFQKDGETDDNLVDTGGMISQADADKKDAEEKEMKRKEEREKRIDKKLNAQKERYAEMELNEFGTPTKTPENVQWGDEKGKKSVIKALDEVVQLSKSSRIMSEEEKIDFSTAIDKIKNDQVEDMSDNEVKVLKEYLAVKDQSGTSDPNNRGVQFYLADVKKNDWRFGSVSNPEGGSAIQARLRTKKGYGKSKGGVYYEELQKLREAVGLKSASPTNSRTTSKMMAPTTVNMGRKKETIEVKREGGRVVSASIAGQTHTKKSVPRVGNVERELISQGVSADDAKRQARSVVLGIQRYNDQIDLLADAEGDLEIVDYGDVSTTEGRRDAISKCLLDVSTGLEKALEKTTPPHPPLTREHYELAEKIKNIKNPLEDSEWDDLSFEERQERSNKFNKEMGEILVDMNALGDMMTSRAEVAESITYMHRLSQGYNAILPSSETFKVTDVFAIKDPGDTSDPKVVAESIQQILVSVEAAGGESVKFEKGARSSSAAKVLLTVYKNKDTRRNINSLLDTYDKIYRGDDYPPSDEIIEQLDSVRDETKDQVVRDNIMSEEEYDRIYELGMKTGEKAFESMLRKNRKKLEMAGFTGDDLRRVKDSFMKHCAHGNIMAEMNNRDTEYNKFNNVAHKILGFKKDKQTGEVTNKGKYKTVEADGINVISGMNFSCDQGFKIANPPKKKISPENTNPSAVVAIDPTTGKERK